MNPTALCRLAGLLRIGKSDLICESGLTCTPSVGAESITTPAAPQPWSRRICVSVPPKEWPMMIGGRSSSVITSARWDTVCGTVSVAITEGSSRRASTSTSNPGYVGVRTRYPLPS